jgi:hypothetical protein
MTIYTTRADIVSLAFSERLVNMVCLIVWTHISVTFLVSKIILYSLYALYL